MAYSSSQSKVSLFSRATHLFEALGPGILYAGAAVGVSHLVQSTKAGALFGFPMILGIILIHIVKYPFFEIGARYPALTGKSLLHAYKNLGTLPLAVYGLMTFCTMCIIQSAITVVTASLLANFVPLPIGMHVWSLILLLTCSVLLLVGHLSALNRFVKMIVVLMSVTTVTALVLALFNYDFSAAPQGASFSFSDPKHLLFLAAFLGWMPAPLDITVWQSIWAEDTYKNKSNPNAKKNAVLDFRVGYFGTAALAVCFLSLGAMVMHGSGEAFSDKGVMFASQFVGLYEKALGSWAFPIIAFAAITTMFSTALTCLDAFPRSLAKTWFLIGNIKEEHEGHRTIYKRFLLATILGTVIIIFFYLKSMAALVTLATVVAFLAAPILAYFNYQVWFKDPELKNHRPSKAYQNYALVSVTLLGLLSVYYAIFVLPKAF